MIVEGVCLSADNQNRSKEVIPREPAGEVIVFGARISTMNSMDH